MATSSPKLFMTAGLREVGRTGVGPSAPSIPANRLGCISTTMAAGYWPIATSIVKYAALAFRLRSPNKLGDFLEVRRASATDDSFPRIQLGPDHRGKSEGGELSTA